MPSPPACFAAACRLCGIALAAALLALGCGREPLEVPGAPLEAQPPQPVAAAAADRDEALAVLDAMQREAFDGAFGRLQRYAFVRRVRTEQMAGGGEVVAFRTRTIRYAFQDGARIRTLLTQDADGAFDFGFVGRFVSADKDRALPDDLAGRFFPEDPSYLSPRNRALYTYRLSPDTLWAGRPTRVVAITAGPEARRNRPLRRARFYVDAATNQLVGFRLERLSETLLFDEASRLFARLEPAPDTGWVPAVTRAHVQTRFPLGAARQFRTASTFTEYAVP